MTVTVLAWLFMLGAVVGLLAGLMGIGGGMLMVPFLVTAFAAEGYPQDVLIKMAIGTSLATILFTSVSSVLSHHRLGAVRWPVVRALAPGIVLGALLGTQLVGIAPADLVAIAFALFLLFSAWRLARPGANTGAAPGAAHPGRLVLTGVGTVIGLVSAIVGAGGGFLTIPWLIARGEPASRAIGSSAACGLPIALAGAIGYWVAGAGAELPGAVLGFIHVPALLAIAAASVLTAPVGARLAGRLPAVVLKRLLAGVLTLLAAYTLAHTL